uniref:Putative ovule protein n=1 Tax=Solanum chacoense TaxID=4108 RepID=A0A0V0H3G5_SOLCH
MSGYWPGLARQTLVEVYFPIQTYLKNYHHLGIQQNLVTPISHVLAFYLLNNFLYLSPLSNLFHLLLNYLALQRQPTLARPINQIFFADAKYCSLSNLPLKFISISLFSSSILPPPPTTVLPPPPSLSPLKFLCFSDLLLLASILLKVCNSFLFLHSSSVSTGKEEVLTKVG